jgi:hypothetical protein
VWWCLVATSCLAVVLVIVEDEGKGEAEVKIGSRLHRLVILPPIGARFLSHIQPQEVVWSDTLDRLKKIMHQTKLPLKMFERIRNFTNAKIWESCTTPRPYPKRDPTVLNSLKSQGDLSDLYQRK